MSSYRVTERIRIAIKQQGISKTEVAQRLGVTKSYLSHILSGRNAVTALNAIRLERVLGLDARELLITQVEDELAEAREEEQS